MKKISNLIVFILFACQGNKIQEIELQPLSDYENKSSESVIFAGISSMDFANNFFLMTEFDYDRYYLLSRDRNEILEFNDTSKVEFPKYPSFGRFYNNNIWLYSSEFKKVFQLFNQDIVNEVKVDSHTDLLNFDVDNERLIYSRVDFSGPPFVHVDLKTGEETFFGKYFDNMKDSFLNHYLLTSYSFIHGDNYIFVLPYNGMILKFDKSFALIDNVSVLDYPNFSQAKEFVNNYYQSKTNSLVSIVSDCKIINNKLYMLVYERNPNFSLNPRTVLVFDLNNKINLEKVIKIGGEDDYFTKFCKYEKNVFAFFEYQTSSLKFFEFPYD
ncbi:hypothetical protein DFQ04_3385 [Algoriphagus boseongensis]|uniref:Uncharacterized protein n=1 Tax=Algoriphagus boseongensis TaxID=1442587 RepID=A0A4R6T2G1_9BACT|nr:hypothetical protein [Algoriphagus boseongensis]TDQ14791.1 hypothetical protein DFQ04_3385 [Algoriphagus boseongensis]